jgi:hypothetical protein
MKITNVLVPNAYKIKKDKNGNLTSVIVDEELDPFNVEFTGDDCVQIETEGTAYIILSKDSLNKIIDLIEKAEIKYLKTQTR